MVEHHGTHYDFDRLEMSPPPSAAVPIFVGGGSAPALRRAGRIGEGWIGAGNAPEEFPAIVQTLRSARRDAGREHGDFGIIAALSVPLELDLVRRMEDAGVTGLVSWPFAYTIGPGSILDAKRAYLARFGDEVISKAR